MISSRLTVQRDVRYDRCGCTRSQSTYVTLYLNAASMLCVYVYVYVYDRCRYKFAMQDVKTILSMPGDKVGAAIWKLANEMQHRLNRVIAQQKAMG